MAKEIYISVDIEASGPVPALYSMLALGACVVGRSSEQFQAKLKPINDSSVPEAMAIIGSTLQDFRREGTDPAEVMPEFGAWVERVKGHSKPVFVGFNAAFDWSFVNWYFAKFFVSNPFGVGGLDIKAFYMGMTGCAWEDTRSSRLPSKYRGTKQHAHDALLDAIEQAEIFEKMARDAGTFAT